MLTFGSVCSGIEAASAAWKPLGWRCAFASEIEAFPRAVLKHRHPETPLHGDFTTIQAGDYEPIDLLVGGTPCQSFSVAGLRGGLDDERGNLALEYLRLADRLRPRWLVWENVPGVLSSAGGRDFGSILGGLGELGYGFAYRVLDAQFFGVAQRRRRVFVVGYLGDWRRAAAVLFERHSLQGHPAPSREAGARAAASLTGSLGRRCGVPDGGDTEGQLIATALRARDLSRGVDSDCTDTLIAFGGNNTSGPIDVATARTASHTATGRLDFESETFVVAHSLRGEGFDASEDGTGRGTPIIPVHAFDARQSDVIQYGDFAGPLDTDGHTMAICFSSKDHGADAETDLAPTLRAGGHDGSHANAGVPPAIAFALRGRAGGAMPEVGGEVSNALRTPGGGASVPMIAASAVRRLTPRECERLQGFDDDYTLIPWRNGMAPDGPRYKALGNSMAVPVMAWIGRRIEAVETLNIEADAA